MQCKHPGPALVATLQEKIAQLEGGRQQCDDRPISSGCPALDRLLPGGGFRRGTLVEWLSAVEGGGTATLAMLAAREACQGGGTLIVVDRRREFYPPAAVRLGISLERLLVVQVASAADQNWALDQALRCPAVAAVLAWPEELDGRTFRRLQLAAEKGGSLGLLLRSEAARREPTWAEVRLRVVPLPGRHHDSNRRRLKIEVLRSPGKINHGSLEVEFDDETRDVHLVPPGTAAGSRRRAGA